MADPIIDISTLKAYFNNIVETNADLQYFVYGDSVRIINPQRSEIEYPVLFLETPGFVGIDPGGQFNLRTSLAFSIVSNCDKDDFPAQDEASNTNLLIMLEVLRRMKEDQTSVPFLMDFDFAGVQIDPIAAYLADNNWGWRAEFTLIMATEVCVDEEKWSDLTADTADSSDEDDDDEPIEPLPGDALIYMNDDESQAVQTTWSAAIIMNDIAKLQTPQLITWSQELGFQHYHGTMHLSQQELDDMKGFADAVGAVLDVFYPIVAYNTSTQIAQYVDACNPEFFQLGGEDQNDMLLADYISKATAAIAYLTANYPEVRIILDSALAYRVNSVSLAWTGYQLDRVTLTGTGVRTITGAENGKQYVQMSDLLVGGLTFDQASNLVKFEQFFSSTPRTVANEFNMLGLYNTFFSQNPNTPKMAIVQMHPEDAGVSEKISNKPLANWAIGRMMKFVFERTDKISYLCWMAWGNLFQQNNRTQEYFSCQMYSSCFSFANTFTVDFAIEGVEGVGFHDGAGTYGLCITSKSETANIITAEQIGAATGVTVQGDFSRRTRWAESWDDDLVGEDIVETDLTIRECSGSFVIFQAA